MSKGFPGVSSRQPPRLRTFMNRAIELPQAMTPVNGSGNRVEAAIGAMRREFAGNDWLLNEHWPLNEPHVRLMAMDLMDHFPPGRKVRLLDVGCANGYMSFIFSQLGYDVTGVDMSELPHRDALFARAGINFVRANLNDANPFQHLPAASFDIVIIAQVIEHVLNHPLGLLRQLTDAMRPGGAMILTTPTPANVMNAVRTMRGRSLLWGTQDFIDEPKFGENGMISEAEIHYREYTSEEVRHLLEGAGLGVERSRYLPFGSTRGQSAWKQLAKNNPLTRKLMTQRLFASNHYFLARKA